MTTITVGNSYSRITGLTPTVAKQLKNELSYTVGNYFSGWGPKKKSLLSKRNEFPTGLLATVHDFLAARKLQARTIYQQAPPSEPTMPDLSKFKITPYEDQLEAAATALAEHRGVIAMPTGTGKSLVIALIAAGINTKTLIVVPSLEIKKQLRQNLEELLTTAQLENILVENIDSAKLKKCKDFGCLIIDEAHHTAANTYQKLNKTAWVGTYYRYFLTATPFRNDPEEQLLFKSIAGEIIYELNYKTAVDKKYIVPIEAYYIETPKQDTDAYTYAQVYKSLVVDHEPKNKEISDLLGTLDAAGVSTLCLVREIAHGVKLSQLSGIPFVNGENTDSRKYIQEFNSGKLKVLIGTTGVLGEGVDTKPCEYVIIAGLGKAKSQFMQQVGRAVRQYPGKETAKVILIKDKSHKFLTRHFKAQTDILTQEYGVIPLKLERP